MIKRSYKQYLEDSIYSLEDARDNGKFFPPQHEEILRDYTNILRNIEIKEDTPKALQGIRMETEKVNAYRRDLLMCKGLVIDHEGHASTRSEIQFCINLHLENIKMYYSWLS